MIGLLSVIEPAIVDEALSDDGWILAMQEELNQFQRNDVWDLVPKPPQLEKFHIPTEFRDGFYSVSDRDGN